MTARAGCSYFGVRILRHVRRDLEDIAERGYTDVLHNQDAGDVKLVGPIPEEVQNYTVYAGAVVASSANQANARTFLAYLESPEAVDIFKASGVVPRA